MNQLETKIRLFISDFVPFVLADIILLYWREILWDTRPYTYFAINYPYKFRGITTDNQLLYACGYLSVSTSGLVAYTLLGHAKNLPSMGKLRCPFAIDIDEEEGTLYVIDQNHVTRFDKSLQFLGSFKLPVAGENSGWRGLKLDKDMIYFTIQRYHQIFRCDRKGEMKKRFGDKKRGSNDGEFFIPLGLTLNEQSLYICDSQNHRVQIVDKQTGKFRGKWGKKGEEEGEFRTPFSIYLSPKRSRGEDDIFYVGDSRSVQVFSAEGGCLQRFGDKGGNKGFNHVCGLCICDGRLHVTDLSNESRVWVFRPKEIVS